MIRAVASPACPLAAWLPVGFMALLLCAGVAQAQTGTSRLYTPGAFDEIEVQGSAEVRFAQGDVDQVLVEGDDNVQRDLRLDVREGRLNIRQAGSWKFWNSRRLQMTVTARDLKRLIISGAAEVLAGQPVKLGKLLVSISGAGQARFEKLQADELRFSVSGAGDGQFAGTVDQLSVTVSGKSDFRGEQLQAQHAKVSISGLAEVKTWVERDLTISISGIGTVDYWGSPAVKRASAGIASVNAKGAKPAPP